MHAGELGDGDVEEKLGRDRTQEVACKLRVRVYATVSYRIRINLKEIHVRDESIKFSDSLVQTTGRTREMPEVMPDDLRGFPKPERELQEDDIGVRFVRAATVPQYTAISGSPIEVTRPFIRSDSIDELGQYVRPREFLLK